MYAVTSFTVDEAYKDIGFLIAESLKLSEIRLKEDIDSELTVKGSKNALSQVFLSIIHNSIFFLNAREIKDPFISVSIWRQGQHVRIDISDNAKGVEPKRLDKIFDFNYSYRDEKKRSTGLGLYICKMIVHESFKGKITAANGQEGLRISITLPVHIRY